MQKWIVPILFLILPFALIMPGLIWKSQQLFFLLLPLFIVAVSLKNNWIKGFLLYAGIWQIFLFLFYFANPKGPGPGNALSIILCLMSAGLIYKFVSESKLPNKTWFTVMRIAVILQIIIAIFQFCGFNVVAKFFGIFFPIKEFLKEHMVGSLGNRNYLTSFVVMTLPMFIVWKKGFFLPFIAFLLIFAPSPASLAAIFGATFYFAYWKWGKPRMIILSLLISGLIAGGFVAGYVLRTGNHLWEFQALPGQVSQFFTKGSIDNDIFRGDVGRFGMWLIALGHLIKSIPGMIFGFGPGSYWGRDYPLHSEYMAVWFYFGLIGLFLLFGYIYTTWKFLWRSKNLIFLTSFLIICIDSVANFPFEIATTGMMGMIILGLIERERING